MNLAKSGPDKIPRPIKWKLQSIPIEKNGVGQQAQFTL